MSISRRDLGLLLPALAAARAAAQTTLAVPVMTSKAYPSDRIPYKGDDKKKGRQFFLATTHAGFKIECHETVLGPGLETHPPHQHEHEEIMVVAAGTVEANLDGVKQTVPAGSVVVFGSNQMHNARNVGATPSRYYIVELRGSEV
ncbi:MAG TPA: cupin domain-containing protein [Bryobacteraceae bacterium]|nr:cupin domain-containing protein [Bryobacteraceae bacterium]